MVKCLGHSAAVRHASRNTQAPILSMSRSSSATGMKTSGGIKCAILRRQADERLEADEAALRHFEERLVVQLEAIMQHRVADGLFEFDALEQLGVHLGLRR